MGEGAIGYRMFGFELCLFGLPPAAQAQEASQPLMPANGVCRFSRAPL